MLVLGIDGASAAASVALVDGASCLAEVRLTAGARGSRELLPAVERVLAAAGRRFDQVLAFAAVRGPGSFTGLRVGLATVRGLALASRRPAAGYCALDLLAAQAPPEALAVCALIDAGRGELYAGFYRRAGQTGSRGAAGWERTGEYEIVPAAAAVARAREGVILGSGAPGAGGPPLAGGARLAPHRPWLALDAARALAASLDSGEPPDPESLRPIYIRPSEAERTRRWATGGSVSSA
jgi:tRNA threonylcarbamoyladenosine biosynthesis protein TsaB